MTRDTRTLRGVVLAGGNGTRLHPTSLVLNKHLLDVYDRPMICYPLATLRDSGVTEVVIVTGKRWIRDFRSVLASFDGLCIEYAVEPEATGVAGALAAAESAVTGCAIVVMLGDTLLQLPVRAATSAFLENGHAAQVLLHPVHPHRARHYGIAVLRDGCVDDIQEKPVLAASALSVVGCYWYDESVFDRIRKLTPSARGELEISDLNALYAQEGKLAHQLASGWVADAGTPAGKLRAALLVALERGVQLEL
jgi:glucose-1-phosphate thymidylyltransferase